jgi:acyl-CoA hydrolase
MSPQNARPPASDGASAPRPAAKTPADSRTTLTVLMGPGEANLLGNVHGGHLMKLCDEAGGITATKHARHPAVTVALDSMTFHSPVRIGNVVTFTAEVTWTGTTSMETRVVVAAEDLLTGAVVHTNTAYLVYVALGPDGRPTPVPPLLTTTEEEIERRDRAAERQARRLRQQEEAGP